LIKSIENSKQINLSKLIYSLGIRYVGEETAYLLSEEYPAQSVLGFINQVKEKKLEELVEIQGIGDKVATSIYNYFHDVDSLARLEKLSELGVTINQEEKVENEKIKGKTFVLTGSLGNMSRDEAKAIIKDNGGKTSSSVSAKTDYLLAGKDPGSKFDKAKKLEVKIINSDEFRKLI